MKPTRPEVVDLIAAIGAPTAWPRSENEVWARTSTVWNWLGANVRTDNAAYSVLVAAAAPAGPPPATMTS